MVVTRRQQAQQQQQSPPVQAENGQIGNGSSSSPKKTTKTVTPLWVYLLLLAFALLTVLSYPRPFQPHGTPTIKHVFFYGWMTAISTGLGVLPFAFLPNVATYWVGVSNGTSS